MTATNGSGEDWSAILAAFAGHPSMKQVVIVDEDIDIDDSEAIEWALSVRFQGHRDLIVVEGARGSSLDPSVLDEGSTTKLGFDATIPFGADPQPFLRHI